MTETQSPTRPSAATNRRVPVDGTVFRLTLGGLLGRRRGFLLLALPAVLLAVAICIRLLVGVDNDAASNTLSEGQKRRVIAKAGPVLRAGMTAGLW